jgi:hypothetical protein
LDSYLDDQSALFYKGKGLYLKEKLLIEREVLAHRVQDLGKGALARMGYDLRTRAPGAPYDRRPSLMILGCEGEERKTRDRPRSP